MVGLWDAQKVASTAVLWEMLKAIPTVVPLGALRVAVMVGLRAVS